MRKYNYVLINNVWNSSVPFLFIFINNHSLNLKRSYKLRDILGYAMISNMMLIYYFIWSRYSHFLLDSIESYWESRMISWGLGLDAHLFELTPHFHPPMFPEVNT